MSNDNVNKLLKSVLKKLGIETITLHMSFSCQCTTLSERPGHAGIKAT